MLDYQFPRAIRELAMNALLLTSNSTSRLHYAAQPSLKTSSVQKQEEPRTSAVQKQEEQKQEYPRENIASNRTFAATGNVLVDEVLHEDQSKAIFSRGFCIHSLLASHRGSVLDICALLCSFFCGFGFVAYVCNSKVLTVQSDRATLWDPFLCQRQPVDVLPTTVLYGYGCRLEPLVENPSAVTSDPRVWKMFELPLPLSIPALIRCVKCDEIQIENEVKRRICERRHTRQTRFDKKIAAPMRRLLHSYEASKLNESCDVWTPHVNDAIRNLIPKGSSIKVAPVCVHSADG
jgi:hypothetical protein